MPSVREQHNAGYKHKIQEHLGQTTAYQQVGAAYNALRPRSGRKEEILKCGKGSNDLERIEQGANEVICLHQ
ncbi:unnamed protein product [Camellia sinensis]